MVDEASTKRGRPLLVWLIAAVMVLSVLGTNAYFLAHLFGMGSNETYAAGLANMTPLDYARRTIAGILSLAAAVSLFLLRKVAIWLFAAILVLGSLLTGYSIAIRMAPISSAIVLAFPALVLWYAWRLERRGVLV